MPYFTPPPNPLSYGPLMTEDTWSYNAITSSVIPQREGPRVVTAAMCAPMSLPRIYDRWGNGVQLKPAPGGPLVTGPGGAQIAPVPMLPPAARGPAMPAGQVVSQRTAEAAMGPRPPARPGTIAAIIAALAIGGVALIGA
jgi:hypothetical protein